MIVLKGLIYGKKFVMECEDKCVCMALQSRLVDVMDIQSREGCLENCIDCYNLLKKWKERGVVT
jgi:hypothetical protein